MDKNSSVHAADGHSLSADLRVACSANALTGSILVPHANERDTSVNHIMPNLFAAILHFMLPHRCENTNGETLITSKW